MRDMEILRKQAQPRSAETLHEFFKVFLPDKSSTRLCVPKPFTKFFGGMVPREATLVDHNGNSWDIELEKIEDRVVFKNGWQKFAREKCLQEADFLVFEYNGKSTFHVKIFSKNGCRKEAANSGRIVPIVILDDDSDQSCRKIQRSCKRKHSRTGLKVNEKSYSEGPYKGTRGKSKRVHEANVKDYEKALGLTKCVPLKNPHFVISFSEWTLKQAEVPKSVLRQWNIKLGSKMSLRDENDKVWPVRISNNKAKRHYIVDGWTNFRNSNNIQEGHQCDFEFVLGKANLCKELLVRIHPPSK